MNACGASESYSCLSFFDLGQMSREWACDTLVFFSADVELETNVYILKQKYTKYLAWYHSMKHSWYYLYNKYLLLAFYTHLFTVLYLAIESCVQKNKQTDRHRHIYYIFTDCRVSVSYLCLNVFYFACKSLLGYTVVIWYTYLKYFFFSFVFCQLVAWLWNKRF